MAPVRRGGGREVSHLSWNCNGLGKSGKGRKFNDFIVFLEALGYPLLVFLQETHGTDELVRMWRKSLSQYFCYFSNYSSNSCGTAVLVHKSLSFQVIHEILDTDGRYVILKGFLYGKMVTLGSIYAPADCAASRVEFFDDLMGVNLGHIHYLFGDYNSVLDNSLDRPNRSSGCDRELKDFVESSGSIDVWRFLHPNIKEFSFNRIYEDDSRQASRIDLCLVSAEVVDTVMEVQYLDSFRYSDHKFLRAYIDMGKDVIGADFKKLKPATIKSSCFDANFKLLWEGVLDDFACQIEKKVESGDFVGSLDELSRAVEDGCDFSKKIFLQNLTVDALWWDDLKSKVLSMGRKVQRYNRKENIREHAALYEEFLGCPSGIRKDSLKQKVKTAVEKVSKEDWFQAKVEQRSHFEKCSHSFFKTIRQDKKNSFVDKVQDENMIIKDLDMMMDYFVDNFSSLYSKKLVEGMRLDRFFEGVTLISENKVQDDGIISMEEVRKIVFRMASDKCPGNDGIPVEFYQRYFNTIGPFLVKMFNVSYDTGVVPKSWNTSIIKLIPKGDGFVNFDSMRPISLINVDCKIFSAVWASRMSIEAPGLVNEFQTGGIKGRKIQDNTLLINLLIQYMRNRGLDGFILSVDNSRAFCNLDRDFVFDVVERFGYSARTVRAIKLLYQENYAKVIINGFFSRDFEVNSGVRQGCPLSTILYVLAVEPLSVALMKARSIQGFRLPNNQEVRLVQHVDDLNMLVNNASSVLNSLKIILDFGKLSGCVLNRKKCFIMHICDNNPAGFLGGIPVLRNESEFVLVRGERKLIYAGESRKIFGIYFGANILHYINENWKAVFKKCKDAVSLWEGERLSLIGKVLILNVKVMPKIFYLMQAVEPIQSWIAKFKTLFREFIWGNYSKIPLSVLEWPKDRGGLGLVSLVSKARSLRFDVLKCYLERDVQNSADLSPVNTILAYFLDIPVRCRYRHSFVLVDQQRSQLGGALNLRGNKKSFFQHFLDDVALFTKLEASDQANLECTGKMYYKVLTEDFAVEIRRKNRNLVHFDTLSKSEDWEQRVWKRVFHRGLDTKVQAFNYKLAHKALPTLEVMSLHSNRYHTGFCPFCREKFGVLEVENEEHIFVKCYIARAVWFNINYKLLNNGLDMVDDSAENLFYKADMSRVQGFFVSEVLWSLWINRCTNLYEGERNDHVVVLKILKERLLLNSKIDSNLLSIKIYRNRWLGVNQVANQVL